MALAFHPCACNLLRKALLKIGITGHSSQSGILPAESQNPEVAAGIRLS